MMKETRTVRYPWKITALASLGIAFGVLASAPSNAFQPTVNAGSAGVSQQTVRSAMKAQTNAVANRVRAARRAQVERRFELEEVTADVYTTPRRLSIDDNR
jgi:hypothetical protein